MHLPLILLGEFEKCLNLLGCVKHAETYYRHYWIRGYWHLTAEFDQVEYLFSMGLIVVVSIYGKNGVGHSFRI